jgi:hypothetical protein
MVMAWYIFLLLSYIHLSIGYYQYNIKKNKFKPSSLKNMKTHFESYFEGEFSNEVQANEALLLGKPTAALGGHEFITVSINSHPSLHNIKVAIYRIGNNVAIPPFRFRFYELFYSFDERIIMKIYRPTKFTEAKLLCNQYNIKEYLPDTLDSTTFEYLNGCDVEWTCNNQSHYKGELINKSCIICSQNDPNMKLLIKDDLNLWENELWICDKAYTTSGQQIIGNKDGIPYKLKRTHL